MDESAYPSLPNLTRLSAQLAADSRRVSATFGDPQQDDMEVLLEATMRQDWEQVVATAQRLAGTNPSRRKDEAAAFGSDDRRTEVAQDPPAPDDLESGVVAAARAMCRELAQARENARPSQPPPHLDQLLDACRAERSGPRKPIRRPTSP